MKKNILKILFILIFISYSNIYAIDISSPSAIVICNETGRVLYNHNGYEKRKMASLTKMMTAILLCENCDMNEQIQIEPKACYIGGSEAGIKQNDIITAKNLLYGMLLPSGNDCALAIAYHIGGNVENFASLMNKKAQDLNLNDTHFDNPHGLDSDTHFSSAYSLAMLTKYAISIPEIKECIGTRTQIVNFGSFNKTLNNTNRLLRTYPKTTGGKTGYTDGANRCLIATAKDNDLELISVVLGSETTDIRFNDSQNILEYCFNSYTLKDISSFLNIYINIPIIKGKDKNYTISFNDTKKEALTEEEYAKIYVKQDFISQIDPPMYKGSYLGKYSLLIGDEEIYSKEFYLEKDLLRKNAVNYFIDFIKNMFKETSKI